MKVLLFFSFSWSTFGFRLLPKLVKVLKKRMLHKFGSFSINQMQYYTTSLSSFRKDYTFLHAFVDKLINTPLKSSNKALLFIGHCDKSTEMSSFAGWAVTRSSLEREVRSLNLGPGKLDTLCCQRLAAVTTFFRKELCCPGRNDLEMGRVALSTLRRNKTSIKQKLKREQL